MAACDIIELRIRSPMSSDAFSVNVVGAVADLPRLKEPFLKEKSNCCVGENHFRLKNDFGWVGKKNYDESVQLLFSSD